MIGKPRVVQIDSVVAELQGPSRISSFAAWYYSYGTAYELLRIGMVAAAAAVPSGSSPREAATTAVTSAVLERYHALVLRPSVLEPALRRAFERATQTTREAFAETVKLIDSNSHVCLRSKLYHYRIHPTAVISTLATTTTAPTSPDLAPTLAPVPLPTATPG